MVVMTKASDYKVLQGVNGCLTFASDLLTTPPN